MNGLTSRRRGIHSPFRKLLDPPSLLLLALALLWTCTGCASLPTGSGHDPRDHFERFNRTMFNLNTAVDHAVMRPVARTYVRITPAPVRSGISNFVGNLAYTATIANDIFQGHVKDFARDLARLVVNTTAGIGGFLDPASRLGLIRHERDFGQTLGKWGIHTGSYLVLPFLGPSDVRDAFGTLADRFMTVDEYIGDASIRYGLFGLRTLDTRASALPFDSTIEGAYDPYAFVRSAWFQRRAYKVAGSNPNYLPSLPPLDPSELK